MAKQTLAQLVALAAKGEDQSVTKSGGGNFEPPKAGIGVAVMTDYIEMGNQPQRPFKNKPKPDCPEVFIGFDLTAAKHQRTYTDGEDVEHTVCERMTARIAKKFDKRAKYKKIFDKLAYGRDGFTHMAQGLNEHFKITITHNKGKGDNADKTYANFWNKDGEVGLGAPKHQKDALDEDSIVDLPRGNPTSPIRIFLWGNPTPETWDSLYIDGEKDDGTSKNWIQEKIMSATNFEGSPLHLMLGIDIADLPIGNAAAPDEDVAEEEAPWEEPAEEVPEPVVAPKKAAAKPVAAPAKPTTKPVAKPAAKPAAAPAKAGGKPAAVAQKGAGAKPVAAKSGKSASDDALAALGIL
jgi:hypothetical protein